MELPEPRDQGHSARFAEYPESLFAELRSLYESICIPQYFERKNSGNGRTLAMGVINRRHYGVGEARGNKRSPALLEAARRLSSVLCPDLNWTALAVNQNYEAIWHIDKNNDGESVVVAFGDFTGGELEVRAADGSTRLVCLRHRPFRFRAAETWHQVRPITSGTRYSIVFFRPRFPRWMREQYGDLTYDQLMALLPRKEGQRRCDVRIPRLPAAAASDAPTSPEPAS